MRGTVKVSVYTDNPSKSLSLETVCEFLAGYGLDVTLKDGIFERASLSGTFLPETAERLAGAVVSDIDRPLNNLGTTTGPEIQKELSRMIRGGKGPGGVLYDGLWLQRIFYELVSAPSAGDGRDESLNLIFTGRLFGTFEDRRYHARVIIMGEPALISTSGLVEAPAKPREYYYIKGRLVQTGRGTEELDELYRGRFVEYDDPQISDIMRSYALQAVMYHLTGREFCDSPECCLYNSHWQEEVLSVHRKSVPCDACSEVLSRFRK